MNKMPLLKIKRLSNQAILPTKGSTGAAGYDLCAACETIVPAKGKQLVKTGLSIAVPPGNYARIAPRSGLAWKNFIDTGAGVIDEDYRGEVNVLLFNHSNDDFKVNYGDRIAQMIIEKITQTELLEVSELDETQRGEGGFGSTGVCLESKTKSNVIFCENKLKGKIKEDGSKFELEELIFIIENFLQQNLTEESVIIEIVDKIKSKSKSQLIDVYNSVCKFEIDQDSSHFKEALTKL